MNLASNQTALINARLFEKGVRDALAALTTDIRFEHKPCQLNAVNHGVILVIARMHYKHQTLEARAPVHEQELSGNHGHFSLGKATGIKMGVQMMEAVAERQPQEITLSIKDVSRARDKDNSNRLTMPYGSKGIHDKLVEFFATGQAMTEIGPNMVHAMDAMIDLSGYRDKHQ